MFDNMAGTVGTLIHEDRLAQAAMRRRIKEAEDAGKISQHNSRLGVIRARVAHLLTALAARLAPSIATTEGNTGAATR
jgi:hypothetical protein